MAEFLIGLGGGALVIIVAWVTKWGSGRSKPAAYPDSAQPGRAVMVEELAEDLERVEKALESDRPEAELADLINEALK